jgi:hypothetical protein
MSTVDRLEAESQFPKRIRWSLQIVFACCDAKWRDICAISLSAPQSAAKEDHVNQEFVTAKRADCRANGGDRKGEAMPTINENPSAAQALAGYVSKPAEHWKKEP